MDKWKHDIAESSAFFQGYVDQIFSQNRVSFRVSQIFDDDAKIRELNAERYRRMFVLQMNKLIENRSKEGYEASIISDSVAGLKIIYPHFAKESDSDQSGLFDIYPRTAMCENCHVYIRLDKSEDYCSCHAKLSQFTFVAFCDECGAHYPIDTMSNLRNDCEKCGRKNGLRRLVWKQSDDLGSYSVKCVNCGNEQGLYLMYCDHKDHQTHAKRSNQTEKSRFRGVPARAGILTHPLVLTIPEVQISGDADTGHSSNTIAIIFSESVNYFFQDLDFEIQESLFYIPEFWDKLKSSGSFWSKSQVRNFAKVVGLDPASADQWSYGEKSIFIQGLLVEAFNRLRFSVSKDTVLNEYGINEIHETLRTMRLNSFQEKELQAMSLLLAKTDTPLGLDGTIKRIRPFSYDLDEGKYPEDLGISEIAHISNLNVIQALLGVIEGSTRKSPQLYRVIKDDLSGKPAAYVRKMQTEGIYFKLNSKRILKWLRSNGFSSSEVLEGNTQSGLRNLVISDSSTQTHVYELLHTLSHALIQSSSISTGLESQSISEIIFPSEGMILLYSTNSVNVGGLEHTYDCALYEWLSRVEELAMECPQDPGCMIDEGGACNACLFVPEFVCEKFNEELDRSCLIGGSNRYVKGFFEE